jgi:protein-S-isoprenylcysteine O-methyltransferase Ste14
MVAKLKAENAGLETAYAADPEAMLPAFAERQEEAAAEWHAPAARSNRKPSIPARLRVLFPASAKAVLLNYASAAALLVLGYGFYRTAPLYDELFAPVTFVALRYTLVAYLLLLPVYYATFPGDYAGKCRRFWQAILGLRPRRLSPEERAVVRAVGLKAFYLPLMIHALLFQAAGIQDKSLAFLSSGRFFPEGYWLFLHALLFVDVLIFTIGYGVEHPWLGNEIRSVEPTLLGWVAALACYPPWSWATVGILGWHSADYPAYTSVWVQGLAGGAMLILMGIYAWASVALGFKASNLTYRGVVHSGPYAWVRHPAYIAKNLVWWVGMIPGILHHLATDPLAIGCAIVGMAGWSGIYVLRALTEERHLAQHAEYRAYCQDVPYRFIPGLL